MRSKSAKKNANTAVTRHNEDRQLRVLFDNTNEHGICMLDAKGRIVNWNMSAERLMGHTAEEILGENYSIFFSKNEIDRQAHKRALAFAAKKGHFTADGIRVRKDGSHFWARSSITRVRDEKTIHFVLITQNISKARMLERKREEYVGIASHEMKNPITTLGLYVELLAKRLELESDKENLHILRDMQSQTSRLVALVDDLLIVSKVEAGGTLELHTEAFDMNKLLKKIIRETRQRTSTHAFILKGTLRHLVRADKNRITQVCINLLSNAVKYSPLAEKVIIRIKRKDNKCVVSVQDFGLGISKEDKRDIFTRFFRADRATESSVAGAGLGLYISKEIMKKHREKLWVESNKGKGGSTFSFTLSLA